MAKGKCPICGVVGYLQVLNKSKYFRIRHYDNMLNGKPQFHYHQTLEDANRILALDVEVIHTKAHGRIPMPHNNDQKALSNDSEKKGLALESENKGPVV